MNEDRVRKLVGMNPMDRSNEGLPFTLEDIAISTDVPLSIVEDINRECGFGVVVRDTSVEEPREEEPEKKKSSHGYNSTAWLKKRTEEADKALMVAVNSGKAEPLKLFYQLTGRNIVEKTDVTHHFGADDIAKLHATNNRYLRENGYVEVPGVGQVRSESTLLLPEVRADTGQAEGDNTVGSQALSD